MLITRVKYDGTEVQIAFEHTVGRTTVTSSVTSKEPPTPEFEEALKALTAFVPKLCKPVIVEKKFIELGTVTGISISRKNEDAPGYIITAKCPVDGVNSPLNIATPILVEPEEHSGEFAYRESLFVAFHAIEDEAEKYLRGQRSQVDMFATENGRREPVPATPIEEQVARMERVRDAFVAVLPKKHKRAAHWTDDEMAAAIGEKWENVKTEHEGTTYDGIVRVGDAWCYLGTGPRISFFYDVAAPAEFKPEVTEPDAGEAQLVEWARAAWGVTAKVEA